MNNQESLTEALSQAGQPTTVTPELQKLERLRITPEKQLEPMEFLFQLFGRPCFPRGELVGITGKAKSGKTFVTSMLMAKGCQPSPSSHGGGGTFARNDRLPSLQRIREEPLKVLWYDTEQSDESTQDILRNRVLRMTGHTDVTDRTDKMRDLWSAEKSVPSVQSVAEKTPDVFNVRCVPWKGRRQLLSVAVESCHPDLVIVDGIRDLVDDINDGVLAQEVMEELMQLSTKWHCCIVCILHQNKGSEDHNLRGWIGTELMHKAFEVYACEKLLPQRVFKLEQTLTRKYDIEQTLYYEVGEDGLPKASSLPPSTGGGDVSREQRPQLNSEYILHGEDDSWQFDVMRMFLDAFHGEAELQGSVLRERVMQLSGIVIPFKYNQLLHQALEQKVIEKSQRDGLTVYRPAPF